MSSTKPKPKSGSRSTAAGISLVMALGLALSACGGSDVAVDAAAAPGSADSEASTFPQFITPTVDGSQLDFGSLEGQDALLWFWAPW